MTTRDDKPRRSAARIQVARALWYAKKGVVEIRNAPLPPLAPDRDLVQVRTAYSGVSRGTERLILNGLVPADEIERMRAPLQEGAFPFPVKYGYCATGTVEAGPPELLGRAVFCLHPHQDVFQVPFRMAVPLPDGVSLRRATLAANMETALNALWDSGAGPADRIVVVGAGIVGLLVAYLAARMPGAEVTVIDPLEERRELVERLGARFAPSPPVGGGRGEGQRHGTEQAAAALPSPLPQSGGEGMTGADVVFHTSASEAGLATAIGAAGMEGTIVELSWYGDKQVAVPLGGAFHSQRLKLICSQVGQISAGHRPRWDYRRRLEVALMLLQDERLDALLTTEIAFEDAPKQLPELLVSGQGLAPVIRYG
jgi:threonine dehydrogenase-like Zn-dependent dehydrogenase